MKLVLLVALATLFPQSREELDTKFVDKDARTRREAVIGYARLDTLETWERVVAALRDPKPEVADEAQLQLAALAEPKELALLYGKDALGSKDDFVRLRCAEVLGRLAVPPDVAALEKALGDKDAAVRRTACWSIERQKMAGRWPGAAPAELAELARKDKSPEARAAALASLATCGGLDAEALSGLAADTSAEVRAACVVAARALGTDVAFARANAAAKDTSLGVRLFAPENFAAGRDARGAKALVDQLENEKELRGRWRLVELLRELSGLAHRLDARPWRAWATALGDGPLPPARKPEAGEEDRSATFAGLPIRSERVTFLIDLSGSIWQKRADGRTRKQVLDEELGRALRSLPPSTRFNLIPYTGTAVPWQKGLVAADERNVAKALEWFTGRKDTGVGDFWGALEVALGDPEADTLVVLTDGAPSGGRRWNLGLMKQLFAERNRFRRIEIDAVLADASGRLERDWAELCASSGGRTVEYSLR